MEKFDREGAGLRASVPVVARVAGDGASGDAGVRHGVSRDGTEVAGTRSGDE